MTVKRIAIIGGGLSGASAAVQLVRKSPVPLEIIVVEPRDQIGPGLAYSNANPGFRLNSHAGFHSIDVADPGHLIRWCEVNRLREADPKAVAPNGQLFIRRSDYGRYLSETVDAHSRWQPTGSTISHRQSTVSEIHASTDAITLELQGGHTIEADQVILATGNPPPRLPSFLAGNLAGCDRVWANPLDANGLNGIAPEWRVLVVGAGLTALDVVASLLTHGHKGGVVAVSRRGLRPRPQPPNIFAPPAQASGPVILPLDLLNGPLPTYVSNDPAEPSALRWMQGLREHVRALEAEGQSWHAAFDAFAVTVSRCWPLLPLGEQLRFLRRLRPWYDAHRFRSPPMTDAVVHEAEKRGQVAYRSATPRSVSTNTNGTLQVTLASKQGSVGTETFDAIVNCSGLEAGATVEGNPLLRSLARRGVLVQHPTGLGFVVDKDCRAVSADGLSSPRIRVIGPSTAGVFGDPLGVIFISAQIHRMIPDLLADLVYQRSAAK
ncbi:MAG: FAD/NAD(P)-binding protein [Micropepsaceae bacterium]